MDSIGLGDALRRCRESRRLVLVIVAIALLLDNMLLTIVDSDINGHRRRPNEWRNAPLQEGLEGMEDPLAIEYYQGEDIDENQRRYLCAMEKEDERQRQLNDEEMLNKSLAEEAERKHEELAAETIPLGIMFASKAFVQMITNPFIGPLTNRIGYSIPMFAGFVILFFSTLRMGMLADRYPDDKERGNAMGIALGGLALGVLIGPPFGGFMYEFVGKTAPFLILAVLALGDGLLQLLVLQPSVDKQGIEGASVKTLMQDPYILVAAGAITFANMGIAMLEPSLPLWMMDTMNAPPWQHGAAFLPASISYLIGTNLFGPLGHKMGRWLASLLGLLIIGASLISIPSATGFAGLILPNAGLGFAIGMVDSSMMPELGHLVDLRHSSVYGSVYAIGDVAFCLGFTIGPALAGQLVEGIGFNWMLYIIGAISFLYAPLMILIRNPPDRKVALYTQFTP
ncbi:unnamed protein product [Cyprideis torosa]|uniref:Uncharacterized protein n=1 Tax=Cyprideis torosa TaxID=163714 RepID=A0A7R8ZJJ8_9CRUS|nr:unnamed protein product [Cyprideis torosa]CAG0882436.1 unnamed protein product [Cyprideis torosa]